MGQRVCLTAALPTAPSTFKGTLKVNGDVPRQQPLGARSQPPCARGGLPFSCLGLGYPRMPPHTPRLWHLRSDLEKCKAFAMMAALSGRAGNASRSRGAERSGGPASSRLSPLSPSSPVSSVTAVWAAGRQLADVQVSALQGPGLAGTGPPVAV